MERSAERKIVASAPPFKSRVRQLGGSLDVTSSSCGATIRVSLPLARRRA